jgi:hypothetical protein
VLQFPDRLSKEAKIFRQIVIFQRLSLKVYSDEEFESNKKHYLSVSIWDGHYI